MVFPETTQIPPVQLIISLTGVVDTTPVKLIEGSKKPSHSNDFQTV